MRLKKNIGNIKEIKMRLSELIEDSIRQFISDNYSRSEVGLISHEIKEISEQVAIDLRNNGLVIIGVDNG
jgi:hypothetical protein